MKYLFYTLLLSTSILPAFSDSEQSTTAIKKALILPFPTLHELALIKSAQNKLVKEARFNLHNRRGTDAYNYLQNLLPVELRDELSDYQQVSALYQASKRNGEIIILDQLFSKKILHIILRRAQSDDWLDVWAKNCMFRICLAHTGIYNHLIKHFYNLGFDFATPLIIHGVPTTYLCTAAASRDTNKLELLFPYRAPTQDNSELLNACNVASSEAVGELLRLSYKTLTSQDYEDLTLAIQNSSRNSNKQVKLQVLQEFIKQLPKS